MKLILSPTVGLPGTPETVLFVSGDTITADGTPYDLSAIPEGGEATPEGDHPFVGKITRQDGEIVCTVRVILGPDAEDHQPTDPEYWILTVSDGPVSLPVVRKPLLIEEEELE